MAAHGVNLLDLLKRKNKGLRKTTTAVKQVPLEAINLQADNHDPPTRILPQLYLGSFANASSKKTLREHGITHVLNVATERDLTSEQIEELSITYLHIGLSYYSFSSKMQSKSERVHSTAHAFITSALQPSALASAIKSTDSNMPPVVKSTVLVNCARGRSRSAAIVIGYLMRTNGMTLQEAYCHVKMARPFIGPHFPLRRELIRLEQKWLGVPETSLNMTTWTTLANSNVWWEREADKNATLERKMAQQIIEKEEQREAEQEQRNAEQEQKEIEQKEIVQEYRETEKEQQVEAKREAKTEGKREIALKNS